MQRYRRLTTICCAAVLTLGLAACGGGGDDDTAMMPEPPPPPAASCLRSGALPGLRRRHARLNLMLSATTDRGAAQRGAGGPCRSSDRAQRAQRRDRGRGRASGSCRCRKRAPREPRLASTLIRRWSTPLTPTKRRPRTTLATAQANLATVQMAKVDADAAAAAAAARQALVDAATCTAGTQACVNAHQALVDALTADGTTSAADLAAAQAGLTNAQMALARETPGGRASGSGRRCHVHRWHAGLRRRA